jgi:membrane-bound ClpP family serine protease
MLIPAGTLLFVEGILTGGASWEIYSLGIGIQLQIASVIALVAFFAIAGWILYAIVRAQYSRVKTGKEALIGSKGVATSDLDPKGEIRVMGEFWQAMVPNGPIKRGQKIEVVGLNGMFLMVRSIEEKA